MAEFKIKKEKFDILLNLIAKTDNEELQNAFLDYQNEKNENNEGYLNYLKSVCEGGTSIREKAALPLQNVNVSALSALYDKRLEYEYQIENYEEGSKERIEIEAKFNAIYEAECIVKEHSR